MNLVDSGRLTTPIEFARRVVDAGTSPSPHWLLGVKGCGGVWQCLRLLEAGASGVVLVCPDLESADCASRDAQYLFARRDATQGHIATSPRQTDNKSKTLLVAAEEGDVYAAAQPDRRSTLTRLGALTRLGRDGCELLITTAATLVRKLPPKDVLLNAAAHVRVDEDLDLTAFSRTLSDAGYLRAPVVEDPGSFAIRGGIVDVWGTDGKAPIRIELFGDAVLSMKEFDPDSQRTRSEVRSVLLPPAREAILSDALRKGAEARLRELCDSHDYPSLKARLLLDDITLGRQSFGIQSYLPAFYRLATLWDYLAGSEVVVFEQPTECKRALSTELERALAFDPSAFERPQFPPSELYLAEEELQSRVHCHPRVTIASTAVLGSEGEGFLARLDAPNHEPPNLAQDDQHALLQAVQLARSTTGKGAALDPLIDALRNWHDEGLSVECVVRSNTQATRLGTLLGHRDIPIRLMLTGANAEEDGASVEGAGVEGAMASDPDALLTITTGDLCRGVISRADRVVLITEEEIFGHKAHTRARRKTKARAPLQDLRSLQIGDYVIHSEHGVGRYLGLQNQSVAGVGQVELLVVEYAGGKLYLPVYRLNQIEKHAGGDSPKLDRLGGVSFAKTKSKARARAREMADELLRLYAERNAAKKTPLPAPDDEYAAFEAAFPYEETSDQANAILDVSQDLERDTVMDRLVCGDVGFGKTEVALRAAFRAISDGRQVALLCPTTVLAQQHYLTFKKRLDETAFEVRAFSRFQSKKELSESLAGLKAGSVDIAIGTHRLLSQDVQFKNLGLLIIDEEQRFGVVHKERMKKLRTQVDVLTLTATPIPRTLQLALGGLREVSYIATPPADRRAIRTVVARNEDTIVKEAIERELARGGQVYYVYNRVEGLYERAERLSRLLPNLRIGVGHGQMRETSLEKTMLAFVSGDIDVLVSTAIVESGLDIARANTMLIDRADLFGLAQLYQLRGRVGRSEQRAYCYLLVPAPSEMSDVARTRIDALERYTELGSGFQVATLDMELRGAGDLLGAEQSGVVATVGLELFCRMLEEATAELRGEEVVFDIDPELNFDVEALIPATYIDEVGVRLSLYKRLASAADEHEVTHLAQEMEDRFGGAPSEAMRLVELMRIKTELRRLKVLVCEGTASGVSLRFRDDTPLNAAHLAQLVATQKATYRLNPDGKLTRKAKETEPHLGSIGLAEKMLDELLAIL